MGLREGPATRPPDRPTDAPWAAATPPRRDQRKFCSRCRWCRQGRARAGQRGARQAGGRPGPRSRPGQGACASGCAPGWPAVPCRGDNVGLAVGRALPGAGRGPRATCGRRRPGARAAGRPRLALPSRPRLRPTRVPAAPGAPGPAGAGASLFRVCKVASGPLASGLEDAAARGVGGPGPWARRPELLSARPPPAVGRRGRRETGRGASRGRRGESGTGEGASRRRKP